MDNQERYLWKKDEYDKLVGKPHFVTLPTKDNDGVVTDIFCPEEDIVSESLPEGEKYGLKKACLLNCLDTFHACDSFPCDLMLDSHKPCKKNLMPFFP